MAGSVLGHHRHVCAFFNSRDEEYRVLLPFIKEGFEGGENASHIVNPKRRAEHLERLGSVGINTNLLQESGGFVVRDWRMLICRADVLIRKRCWLWQRQ
jgi:hypothetical protein